MQEHKFHDFVSTSTNLINTFGSMQTFSDIAQGLSDSNRVGDKLVMNSLELNYWFQSNTSLPSTNQIILRVIVFIWKDDTVPTLADILANGVGVSPEVIMTGPLSHDRKVKRKLLYDKTFYRSGGLVSTAPGLAVTQGNAFWTVKHFLDLKKLPVPIRTINYQGGSVIGVNKVYQLVVSNIPVGVVAANAPNMYFYHRTNYVDG